jgi:hypothetical protein
MSLFLRRNAPRELRRPIHLIGRRAPEQVTPRSPIDRSSTGHSPFSVKIRVPRAKQAGSISVPVPPSGFACQWLPE